MRKSLWIPYLVTNYTMLAIICVLYYQFILNFEKKYTKNLFFYFFQSLISFPFFLLLLPWHYKVLFKIDPKHNKDCLFDPIYTLVLKRKLISNQSKLFSKIDKAIILCSTLQYGRNNATLPDHFVHYEWCCIWQGRSTYLFSFDVQSK